jgi:hypothetical protein
MASICASLSVSSQSTCTFTGGKCILPSKGCSTRSPVVPPPYQSAPAGILSISYPDPSLPAMSVTDTLLVMVSILCLSHWSIECLALFPPFCMCLIFERPAPVTPNICAVASVCVLLGAIEWAHSKYDGIRKESLERDAHDGGRYSKTVPRRNRSRNALELRTTHTTVSSQKSAHHTVIQRNKVVGT